jgi:hypothetical protein
MEAPAAMNVPSILLIFGEVVSNILVFFERPCHEVQRPRAHAEAVREECRAFLEGARLTMTDGKSNRQLDRQSRIKAVKAWSTYYESRPSDRADQTGCPQHACSSAAA